MASPVEEEGATVTQVTHTAGSPPHRFLINALKLPNVQVLLPLLLCTQTSFLLRKGFYLNQGRAFLQQGRRSGGAAAERQLEQEDSSSPPAVPCDSEVKL